MVHGKQVHVQMIIHAILPPLLAVYVKMAHINVKAEFNLHVKMVHGQSRLLVRIMHHVLLLMKVQDCHLRVGFAQIQQHAV